MASAQNAEHESRRTDGTSSDKAVEHGRIPVLCSSFYQPGIIGIYLEVFGPVPTKSLADPQRKRAGKTCRVWIQLVRRQG
jgi:hypothetical protein